MEASAIPASVGLARTRIALGMPFLRIRSDDQLVSLFRAGSDDAFRVIHDRYRARMFAYSRQMLATSSQDPEDAVQEIFVRAYYGLRATDRRLALRAWLYRIAHNRCVDDLRRPQLLTCNMAEPPVSGQDPVAKVEQRDTLRRLISDVQRLPEQQRSALLMRELSGMPYDEVSDALSVSVPAVKSLLVRARVSLAQASEARDTDCADIRADIILAHDRGVRTSGLARRHIRDCQGCRAFRTEVRGVSRQLAALTPTVGPFGVIANLLGWGGGGAAAGSGALAGGGTAAGGGAVGTGAATSAGLLTGGAGHVVTLLAAAVVTAGGAVEVQSTLTAAPARHAHHQRVANARPDLDGALGAGLAAPSSPPAPAPTPPASAAAAPSAAGSVLSAEASASATAGKVAAAQARQLRRAPLSETLDPDMYVPRELMNASANGGGTSSGTAAGSSSSPNDVAGASGSSAADSSTGQAAGTTATASGGSTSSTQTPSSGSTSGGSSTSSGSSAGGSVSGTGSGGSSAATTTSGGA